MVTLIELSFVLIPVLIAAIIIDALWGVEINVWLDSSIRKLEAKTAERRH
jgi:hypothetical protein